MSNANESVSETRPAREFEQAYYDGERRESAKLPHRRHGLEYLAVMLQTTPLRKSVSQVIDAYKAALPPQVDQDEEDKLWRLLLHRIDTRNFVVSGTTEDGRALIQASEPASDIQAVLEQHRPGSEAQMNRWNLLGWGRAVFTRDASSFADPSLWREKLAQAQESAAAEREAEDAIERKLADAAPDYVAAVCGRDHWDQLSEEQQTWCANRICAAVVADAETSDDFAIVGRNPFDGSRPAAFVLSALFDKVLPSVPHGRLIQVLAIALTHPIREIVEYAVQGVGSFLWDTDRDLALTCVGALAEHARKYGAFLRQGLVQHRFDPSAEEDFRSRLRQDTRLRINSRTSFCLTPNWTAAFSLALLQKPRSAAANRGACLIGLISVCLGKSLEVFTGAGSLRRLSLSGLCQDVDRCY